MKREPAVTDIRGFMAAKVGGKRFALDDPYYAIISVGWTDFLLLVLGLFVVGNVLFALLFFLVPGSLTNARIYSFSDAFFFSVGAAGGMVPATLYGKVVSTTAIFVKTFLTALVTGAFFARFARPRARLIFSKNAVVGPYGDGNALMIRVASRRFQGISGVTAQMSYVRSEPYGDNRILRYTDLKLAESGIPLLGLSWTLVHPIDEESPLWGLDESRLAEATPIMVSIRGFDEAISANVNDRHSYHRENIQPGHEFVNILRDLSSNTVEVDITRIHETRPVSVADATK